MAQGRGSAQDRRSCQDARGKARIQHGVSSNTDAETVMPTIIAESLADR
jgi:hypothetical protein